MLSRCFSGLDQAKLSAAMTSAERARSRRRGVTTVMSGVVGAVLLLGGSPSFPQEHPQGPQVRSREERVQGRIQALSHSHSSLRALLRRMPKGGDLHSHLSGAVRTERLIE